MANAIQAGSYTITSLLQWNVPLGVETAGPAFQPIITEAPESKFTITPVGDGTYKIAIGRYPYVVATSRGFMDYSVSASMIPGANTGWTLEYRESHNTYTICVEDPLGLDLGPLAWTIGIDMVAGEPIQLRPWHGPSLLTKSQSFRITPLEE